MDVAAVFGLSRDPFPRNSDADEQCLPNALAALLSELQAGLRSPRGLSVLIADEGSGKSLLARIFARRLAGRARAALITSPGSSISSLVREALAQLGVDRTDGSCEDELIHTFIDVAARRSAAGGSTAIVIDDAHRLSPQTLAGLARLFCDDAEEPPSLHLFLFGRPDLLDRMNATTDRALLEHLLQICRIEPLSVRDCIRYLERRLAAAAGELGRMFAPEAIDDLIVASGGRLMRLESLTLAALERAARAGCDQVRSEHVHTWSGAEGSAMAGEQQKLRLERTAKTVVDEDEVLWGDETDEEEDWTSDEDAQDEVRLSWSTGEDEEDQDEITFDAGAEDDDEDEDRRAPVRGRDSRRGSFIAMGLFSVAACVLLTWAANSIESPERDAAPGRTTELFTKPVSSEPTEIVRLPVAPPRRVSDDQAAGNEGKQPRLDADAHLAVWSSRDTRIDTHSEDDFEIRELDAEAHEYDGEVMWGDEPGTADREKPNFPKRDAMARQRADREAAQRAAVEHERAAMEQQRAAVDRQAREADARERAAAAQQTARATAIPPDPSIHSRGEDDATLGMDEAMGADDEEMPAAMEAYEEKAPRIIQAKAAVLTPPPSTRSKQKTSAPPARKPEVGSATAKAPAKTGGTTLYTIQLGAFRTRANAEELVSRLGGRRVRIVNDAGLFRVLSGAFDNRKDAAAHEASLRRAGFTTYLRSQIF
ncbi:MAG TPA: AAA family ATPase [Candidatus Limnocylindrales bacterium]|nr:AAA family ATPase [Candidatus Limnocylindrales bacterium]